VRLFFSFYESYASLGVGYSAYPLSFVHFKHCKEVKVIDAEEKIIQIADDSIGNNQMFGLVKLLGNPILTFTMDKTIITL
jgi:hypothetical protein